MSGRKGKNTKSVQIADLNGLFIRVVSEGNLSNVKTLMNAVGLSCCEGWYGGYTLLRDTIESGHFEIAKFLLQKGAKVDYKTDRVSTPLHFATRHRNVELVQLLLEKNAPIDARNGQNETALHVAVEKGCTDIVQILLNKNADVTARTLEGSTPLLLAIETKHEEIFQMLFNYACTNCGTSTRTRNSIFLDHIPLSNPSIQDKVNKLVVSIITNNKGRSKIVDELVDHGFSLSREYVNESLISAAVGNNHVNLVKNILSDNNSLNDAKYNPSLLNSAVEKGHVEMVELLLNSGFDPNAKDEEGGVPLHFVLVHNERHKCAHILRLLFASGADIGETCSFLHLAIEEDLVEVCKVLVENGADVNEINIFKETPLALSCGREFCEESRQKKDEIVQILLTNGANASILVGDTREVVAEEREATTAFHLAAYEGRKEAVVLFLDFGVDVDLRAENNTTPLHWASRGVERGQSLSYDTAYLEQADTVKMLLKFGADIDARGPNNRTVLHFACGGTDYKWENKIVTILLDSGCDINAETDGGQTALDFAVSNAESDDDSSLAVVESIVQHVIKLRAAGLYVSDKNLHLLDNLKDVLDVEDESVDRQRSTFQKKCEAEANRMRKKKLDRQFTLLDVLANSKNPNFVGNESLMRVLQTFNFEKFPLYQTIIVNNLERSKLRFELKTAGQKSLDILRKKSCELNGEKRSVLPLELLELIVSYLSNHEIKCLIRCGKALKDQ